MRDELTTLGAGQSTNGGGALARSNAQRSIAEVQASVMMAKRFPRDQKAATDRIVESFSRPTLAEQSQYQYSRGGSDISGPSIRAAEAIAQQWGNIEFGFRELFRGVGADGVGFSEVEAYAWDLETMTRKPLQFVIRHWRDTKSGGYALRDERDIYEMMANASQRRVRACILSVIPGDVTEVAMRQADITLKLTADKSKESIDRVLSSFAEFGITKAQIEARIQRSIDAIQPAQIVSLRKIYQSLRDGMSVATDWFAQEYDHKNDQKLGGGQKSETRPFTLAGAKDLIAAIVDGPSAARARAYVSRMDDGKDKIEAAKLMAAQESTAGGAERTTPGHGPSPKPEAPMDTDNETVGGPPTFTYAEVCSKIQHAATKDQVDEAIDIIQYVPNEAHRKELHLIANAVLNKIGAK